MILASFRSGLANIPPAVTDRVFAAFGSDRGFHKPLVDAAHAGTIDLIALTDPEAPWPARHLRLSRMPTVILLGDDPGNPAGHGGPPAWRCADRIGRWCAAAMVHAAGGAAFHYAEAVRAVGVAHRLILVETASANARAWADVIGCKQTLLIMPSDGPHPIDTRVLH